MTTSKKYKFIPRQAKVGGGWSVLIIAPDGTQDEQFDLASQQAAKDWIAENEPTWAEKQAAKRGKLEEPHPVRQLHNSASDRDSLLGVSRETSLLKKRMTSSRGSRAPKSGLRQSMMSKSATADFDARRLEGWTSARSFLWPSFETRVKSVLLRTRLVDDAQNSGH